MKRLIAIVSAVCFASVVSMAGASTTHDVIVGPAETPIFSPDALLIQVGDTVRWTWDSDGHNVGSGVPGDPTGAFLSGPPAPAGTVFEVVFDQNFLNRNPEPSNLYYYHCHPHGKFGMVGSIQVETTTTHDVVVGPGGKFVFLPDALSIQVGDTVRWTWDSEGHNVGSGLPGNPTDAFLSGPPAPEGTIFEVTFDKDFLKKNPIEGNVYDYHCHPHGQLFEMIGAITVKVFCPEDLDGDGLVGPYDLALLLGAWGSNPGDAADFNGDGIVNAVDLAALLGGWGGCP